jgi:dienelactone hydrolase
LTAVVLFHHAHGRTQGVEDFADLLRAAGHDVRVPDLYDGNTFDSLAAGLTYAQELGLDAIIERGKVQSENLPAETVYAGFSLGVLPAQMLTQTRPGAKGALLFHACLSLSSFGDRWPHDVPVQIHAMESDPFFQEDLSAANDLVAAADLAELFLYPGNRHLFADNSLPDYVPEAAALLLTRVLDFLARIQ